MVVEACLEKTKRGNYCTTLFDLSVRQLFSLPSAGRLYKTGVETRQT
jgi:hypothetical protein